MNKREKRLKRRKRIRSKVAGTQKRPRVSVFRSDKHIYAQLIDDEKGTTLAAFSSKNLKKDDANKSSTEKSEIVGMELAKKAKTKKVRSVIFDRGGYKYHGRVKAIAEGLRKGGLKL